MSKAKKKSRGRPATHGERQLYTLRLPVRLHRELRMYSLAGGESMNDLLVEVIEDWWKAQPERRTYSRLSKE